MSGPARTAMLTVELDITVTDTATEGEMVDAVTTALWQVHPELQHPGATFKVTGISTSITTKGLGGHL